MKKLSCREIQEESLKILIFVDKLCNELKLNYCIMYGTLIGAIRHNGFIPWDDDVDIAMSRSDYLKLQGYFMQHKEELKPYEFFSKETRENYPYMIGRVCNTDFIMKSEIEGDYGMGTFIDIYPMDGAGNGKAVLPFMKSRLFSSIYYMKSRTHFIPSEKKYLNIPKRIIFSFVHLFSYKFLRKNLEKLVYRFDYDKSEYVAQMDCFSDGKQNMYLKKDLEETVYHEFEGYQVKIPRNYDAMLRQLYGDYMQLPPEEKRIGHHFYSIYKK